MRWCRQFAIASLGLAVAACGAPRPESGTVGYVQGFIGFVAADEPRAALIGRDVLSAGGTAADAAVAVAFALSVTLPVSASLGGGGVCVVYDPPKKGRSGYARPSGAEADRKPAEVIEFLAGDPARLTAEARFASAVPGLPRGMFALHSRYGRLRWEMLLTAAENIARFGIPVSRALSYELRSGTAKLQADPEARRVFVRADGSSLTEGDFLVQVDLAATIGRLRTLGPGDLYVGQSASTFAAAVTESGGTLTIDDLRAYTPAWREPIRVPVGNDAAFFPPPPAGATAAQMFAIMAEGRRFAGAAADERPHLLAEAAARAFADRGRWQGADGRPTLAPAAVVAPDRVRAVMAGYRADRHAGPDPLPPERPYNPAATAIVTVDSEGAAVACSLTSNDNFGSGRIARGTGVLLAAPSGPGRRLAEFLSPVVVANQHNFEFRFAAAAAGGIVAPTALAQVAARVLLDGAPLDGAVMASRVHHSGNPDIVYYEQTMDSAGLASLDRRGHRTLAAARLGIVNAVHCPDGIPPNPKTCRAAVDPRGFGIAAGADR